MMEETGRYQAEFAGKVQGVAVGEGNTIYNYFYYHEVKPVDPEVDDDADLPCPYRGLFHFGPNDAEFFFGRDIFVAELYSATQTRCFIPVLGASGSGKSSVVLAGLVPKLQQEGHWQFTHFRPGADPFHALALALVPLYATTLNETERIAQSRQLATYLRQGDIPLEDVFAQIQQNFPQDRILLIADQFEELYTLCPETETRHRFLDHLIAKFQSSTVKPGKVVLVLTMRADFLGNALSYPAFADQLRSVDIKIRSMNREELAEVIEKPAAKLGVTFEGGLVERILNDVADQPGNLPLLEFALTELWQQQTGKQLTHEVYEAIGQVEGALARHADQRYENLSEAEKAQVRRIFVQLVRPGEGAEDTRRIAMKSELGEQSWSLVKQLADARLVVTSRNATEQETVEVVHEALIRNWSELRGWMETDRVFRAWQERLRVAMRQWEETNRDAGSLLRGAALAEAEERLAERPDDLVAEQEFIQQSIQERERLEKEKAARRRSEIRTAWGIAIGSLVAVAVSTGFFLSARHQQKLAELSEADSLARYSLALLAEGKGLDASVVAVQSGKILQQHQSTDPEVMSALVANIYEGQEINRLTGHNDRINSASFSPDGKLLSTGSSDGTAKLWDVATGREARVLVGHQGSVYSTNFSPDGQIIATSSSDGAVKLWNTATGKEIRTLLTGHELSLYGNSFSSDGQLLATGSSDKTVKIWNVATGKETRTLLTGYEDSVYSASFSYDGQILATGSLKGMVKLWDIQTGKEIHTLSDNGVYNSIFSFDDQTLATISWSTVKLWDVQTGKELHTLMSHDGDISSASFSSDSQTLATSSSGGIIKFWDIKTGEEVGTMLTSHENGIHRVSFDPNGQFFATGSYDGTVKLWNIGKIQETHTLVGYDDDLYSANFSSDGQTLITSSDNGTAKLWDVKTGEELYTLPTSHKGGIYRFSFNSTDQTITISSYDGTVKFWNVPTGEEIRTLLTSNYDDKLYGLGFSVDGRFLVTGSSNNGMVTLWDAITGEELYTLAGHGEQVSSAVFSFNGQTLATGSADGTVKLWDMNTRKELHILLTGHRFGIYSIGFSLNGQILATGDTDGIIELWDIETGKKLHTLTGHHDVVYEVSFGFNDQILISNSDDGNIKLWDVQTGKEIKK